MLGTLVHLLAKHQIFSYLFECWFTLKHFCFYFESSCAPLSLYLIFDDSICISRIALSFTIKYLYDKFLLRKFILLNRVDLAYISYTKFINLSICFCITVSMCHYIIWFILFLVFISIKVIFIKVYFVIINVFFLLVCCTFYNQFSFHSLSIIFIFISF